MRIAEELVSMFPEAWITNSSTIPGEFGETWFDVRHPSSKGFSLRVLITEQRIGVATLLDSEADIEVDLSGFDYSFETEQRSEWRPFFKGFLESGTLISDRPDPPGEDQKPGSARRLGRRGGEFMIDNPTLKNKFRTPNKVPNHSHPTYPSKNQAKPPFPQQETLRNSP